MERGVCIYKMWKEESSTHIRTSNHICGSHQATIYVHCSSDAEACYRPSRSWTWQVPNEGNPSTGSQRARWQCVWNWNIIEDLQTAVHYRYQWNASSGMHQTSRVLVRLDCANVCKQTIIVNYRYCISKSKSSMENAHHHLCQTLWT
jgi:hypothetical protein